MSDRSNKTSFAVSRNLKHAKYRFIEAITDKITESSNTTPNSVSTSAWLCATSNMMSTSHKTWQTSLLFSELLQIQNLKRKSGGDIAYYVPPTWKSGVDTSPVSPTKCAHAYDLSSLEQVFVVVKKRKSCIYVHIWLRKTWHNLFSFARTFAKSQDFQQFHL